MIDINKSVGSELSSGVDNVSGQNDKDIERRQFVQVAPWGSSENKYTAHNFVLKHQSYF